MMRELSLHGRIEILKHLMDGAMTLSELTKKVGCLPTSTISRSLKILNDCCMVKKNGNKFELTGIGYLIADYLSNVEQILPLWEYICDAGEFMKILPTELKPGLVYLCDAEIEPDPYAAMMKAFEDIKKANRYGKYITKIVSYEINIYMIERNIKGVHDYVIFYPDLLEKNIKVTAQAVKDVIGNTDIPIDELRRLINSDLKVLNLPFQLGIIDGKVIYLQMSQAENAPFFISRDKKCVEWGEKIFDYFWEIAEPVDLAAELKRYL
ncbi:hypothetical protein Arcve_1440 [Archaeoglobus veneficus SNP6]|uniref:HVO-A0261-like N-terminal domain-containing protein n=2 Tax=Archaeoglobus veneficus TaxID=58290 RepID=F2KNW6_ARCVS|nr:hypothetical protein Arcve_1440 [Archaeoglobus veneficus SNP6]